MDTLKTGFVVVLLLAVLYGVYVVLNNDTTPPNAEIAWHEQEAAKDLQIDIGPASGDVAALPTADPSSSFAAVPAATPATTPVAAPSQLGIPSVVKAELTPTEDASAAASTEVKPISADDPSLNLSPAPSATPTISAPGLLSAKTDPPKTETTPAADATAAPVKPSTIPELPALREPTTPDAVPSTASSTPSASSNPANTETAPTETPPAADTFPIAAAKTADLATASPETTGTPDATPAAATAMETPGPKAVTTGALLEASMREAHTNIADEKWYQALFLLSKFHGSPDLTSQQEQELVDLLDPLAAKVIYSQEHLVADAYEVQRGETLAQIAEKCQVPSELLANINGLDNPDLLIPGTKLKVVRGPFRADICISKQELTLFSGQLYAGRFPVTIGQGPNPLPGEYRVLEKLPGKDYFGPNGQQVSADDPQNPYGRVYLGLGKGLAIHGSADRGDNPSEGCISLSPLDAYDISCILSTGSSVTIRQ